jgi:hypothetical protein
MNGLVIPVTITVSDYLVSNWQVINITISDDYPPEIHTPLPNIEFDEDTQKSNVFDLDDFFLDIDGDALFYTYGHTNIQVAIKSDNRVDFAATANWFGTEIVTFRAEDPLGALAEDSIIVNVLPVNDAPEIFDIPDQEGTTGELWTLDISSYIADIDNNITELQITVDNEYVVASGLNLVFYSEKAGSHQVTIGVNDGDKNTTYTFNVKFNEAEELVTIQNAIFWAILIILITTLCGSIYIFKRYRGSYKVEDAFLVYNDGTLISHKTNRSWENADEDLVTAMFTAIQEFVRTSFANATTDKTPESSLSEFSMSPTPYKPEGMVKLNEWNLKQLRLQNHDIFIEQGQYVYIAVVFTGTPGWDVHFKVKSIIGEINTNYSDVLKNWSGDMRKLIDLENMIDPLIKKGSLAK